MPDRPIRLICPDCGERHGRRPAGAATWHYGTCDICGEPEMVTEPREFGGLKEDPRT